MKAPFFCFVSIAAVAQRWKVSAFSTPKVFNSPSALAVPQRISVGGSIARYVAAPLKDEMVEKVAVSLESFDGGIAFNANGEKISVDKSRAVLLGIDQEHDISLASCDGRLANSDALHVSEGNRAVLRSIDKNIDTAKSKRIQYLAKANKLQRSVEELEEKRNILLSEDKNGVVNFTESAKRSAIKAMMWRIIAGSVTLVTSLQFSGSLKVALSIVGGDFFSKAATIFIGERLMNKSQAGRDKGSDDVGRSLAKALLWRLFAICNTLTMSLLVAKDLSVASKIAGSDAIIKTCMMFVYERVWANVEYGKEYQIDSWKPKRDTMKVSWGMRSLMHALRLKRRAKELIPV